MSDWEDNDEGTTKTSYSAPPSQPSSGGRTFGSRGRGFMPPQEEKRPGFNRDRGDRDDNRGGFRGRRERDENGDGGFRGRRDRDENGDGGFRGGRRENGHDNEDGDSRPFRRNRDDDDSRPPRRNRNEDGESGGGDGDGEGGEKQPPKSTYIPPEPTENPDEMFNAGVTSGINFNKYDSIEVKVSGEGNIPKPIQSFDESQLRPYVRELIKKSGYVKPTPIQKYSIPILLAGRDMMACAQTGSGKTAAFLVPIINTLLGEGYDLVSESGHVEPQAVIVSPTRELTIQIFNEARKFSYQTKLKVCVAYGGTAVYHQAQSVMRGCNILVATPGRLMDFLGKGRITLSSVKFVVLDEADRMLDMGFLPDMEKLLEHPTMVPKSERQTLMFSATFPDDVQRLAGKFLNDYVFVTVGVIGGACEDVEQKFYEVSRFEKRNKLVELLKQHGSERTLVFVEQKRTADITATFLSEKNFPTTSIHGDREQRQREEALADFKSGKMDILVATAVAARGLDIKNVRHVINVDLPKSRDEYVHRIGRTGRVGNRGLSSSLYDKDQDSALAADLVKILEQAHQEVPDFLRDAGGSSSYSSSRFGGADIRNDSGYSNGNAQETCDAEEW